MTFSVTKGIFSAVGRLPEHGPGTWIQTDATINPGNSVPWTSHRYQHLEENAVPSFWFSGFIPHSEAPSSAFGTLTITADSDDAELYVDGKFLGNAPAKLKLPAGTHTIVLKSSGLPDYTRIIEIPASRKLSLKATLAKDQETE
jgi:PEGA domain